MDFYGGIHTFAAKKAMVKSLHLICIALACAALVSCEGVDIIPKDDDQSSGGEDKPSKEKETLYYTAVEYDSSYDWRKDSLAGNVPCRLLLFKNHKQLLSINLSAEENTVADSDMHRICGGKLYTVHRLGGRTSIRKDGVDMLRIDGTEYICDLLVFDSHIYTLSRNPGWKGWKFRKDGVLLCERTDGSLLGGMYQDDGEICFACLDAEGTGQLFAGGTQQVIKLPEDCDEVLALRRFTGKLNCLYRSEDSVKWQSKAGTSVINDVTAAMCRDFSFFAGAGELYAHAQVKVPYDDKTSQWNDFFWKISGKTVQLEEMTMDSKQILAMCSDDHSLCFAATTDAGTTGIQVYHGGRRIPLDDKLAMISPYALACGEERFCIGLNDTSKGYLPLVMDGDKIVEYGFNGYFTRFLLE